jgi:hypothetical protein
MLIYPSEQACPDLVSLGANIKKFNEYDLSQVGSEKIIEENPASTLILEKWS